MSMRRMPYNADILELISSHMVFNEETNTMELGVNIEIDGNAQVNDLTKMQLFYSGEIEDETGQSQGNGSIYILPLEQDTGDERYQYGLMCIMDDINNAIGVGYWNVATKDFEMDAHSDIGDCLYHFSGGKTATGSISYLYIKYVRAGEIPKYYHHELEFTFADNSKVYLNYPSTNNLVIDSLQDLSAVVKPMTDTKLGYGSGYIYRDGQVWKNNSGTLITSVKDNVEVID